MICLSSGGGLASLHGAQELKGRARRKITLAQIPQNHARTDDRESTMHREPVWHPTLAIYHPVAHDADNTLVAATREHARALQSTAADAATEAHT